MGLQGYPVLRRTQKTGTCCFLLMFSPWCQDLECGVGLLPHWLPVVIEVAIAYSIVEKTTIQVFLEGITDQERPMQIQAAPKRET